MNGIMLLSASDMSLLDGFLYAVIGFIIVLIVLALLVGIFYLSGFIFRSKVLSKDKLFERKKKSKEVGSTVNSDEDDEELIAVISAAIAAALDGESDGDVKPEFIIRHITRK